MEKTNAGKKTKEYRGYSKGIILMIAGVALCIFCGVKLIAAFNGSDNALVEVIAQREQTQILSAIGVAFGLFLTNLGWTKE